MQHFVIKNSDIEMLEDELEILIHSNPTLSTAHILVQIYSMREPEHLRMVTGVLAARLNNIEIIGCSAMGLIDTHGYFDVGVVISLTVFEHSFFSIHAGHVENGCEYETSYRATQAKLEHMDYVKGMLLLLPVNEHDNEKILSGVVHAAGDIPVFGGVAGDLNQLHSTFVFVGKNVEICSFVSVVYAGTGLSISTRSYLGWTPFGEPLEVTEADHNRLISVNHQPAYNLYHYYTGIEKQGFFNSALDFPFILQKQDGESVARVPVSVEGEALVFTANIHPGDKLLFSFGDIDSIFSEACYSTNFYKHIDPDAIYLFSCVTRLALLNEIGSARDQAPFSDIAPTIGFFTFGEIDSQNVGDNILNATIVSVAIKETSPEVVAETPLVQKQNNTAEIVLSDNNTRMSRLMRVVQRMTEKLYQANLKLDQLSQLDPLTSSYNRRVFDEKLKYHFSLSVQMSQPLALILLDIDKFKGINDRFGHVMGDHVLVNLVSILKEPLPKNAVLCRYGGEEFSIILPETSIEQATLLAEELRQDIENKLAVSVSSDLPIITCSFGVCSSTPHDTLRDFCEAVDKLLYEAKERGRNRVSSCMFSRNKKK